MLRKTALLSLLTVSTVAMTGCSSMWTGLGNFSNYMAEKTEWASLPSLRGSKTVKTVENTDIVSNAETTYTSSTTDGFVPVETYMDTTYAPSDYAVSDGSVVDTSDVPCPEGTYLTADNTCMFLEQEDYSASFTQ